MAIISNAVTIADAGAFSVNLGSLVHIKTITGLENNSENIASMSFIHGLQVWSLTTHIQFT